MFGLFFSLGYEKAGYERQTVKCINRTIWWAYIAVGEEGEKEQRRDQMAHTTPCHTTAGCCVRVAAGRECREDRSLGWTAWLLNNTMTGGNATTPQIETPLHHSSPKDKKIYIYFVFGMFHGERRLLQKPVSPSEWPQSGSVWQVLTRAPSSSLSNQETSSSMSNSFSSLYWETHLKLEPQQTGREQLVMTLYEHMVHECHWCIEITYYWF